MLSLKKFLKKNEKDERIFSFNKEKRKRLKKLFSIARLKNNLISLA